MNKTCFKFFCVIFILPVLAKAQWIGNTPGSIYYNGGNVGIGTVNPAFPFEIQGTTEGWLMSLRTNAVNPGQINGLKFYSGYVGDLTKWAGISSVAESIHSNSTGLALYSNANESMRISANGNVGVGTITPLRKFTVSTLGDGNNISSLLRLEQYNVGSPIGGTGVSIDMAIGDNYNLPSLAGQIRLVRSNYNNTAMYFSTALANTLSDKMVIDPYGNIGVGTTSPTKKLTISAQGNGNGVVPLLRLEQYNPGSPENGTGVSIDMAIGDNSNLPAVGGQIRLVRSDYNNTTMYFSTALANTVTDRMIIDPRGNIGIGTSNTQGYKLAVNGDVIATSIKVKPYANWPDYVFDGSYQMLSLSEVKAYIDKHKHLPEIPSAKQVAKNGIDLGEMNMLLVKKVEELTRYLIAQDELLQEQKRAAQSQNEINKIQKERIDQLEKKFSLIGSSKK